MTLTFDARIDGRLIHCTITSDGALAAPIMCFSLLAPARIVSGGALIRSVGGYAEAQLPDLAAGEPHHLTIAYADEEFGPVNRAWLPLGAYLRLADGRTLPLPPLPAGVRPSADRPAPAPDGLRLIPCPERWQPTGETRSVRTFEADHEAFRAVDALATRTGLGPFLGPEGAAVEVTEDLSIAAEGYLLSIAPDRIRLAASDRAGVFHGAITLLTLGHTHDGALPCGTITDAPRFGWRGQHLDCARHFYAPATIRRLLDLMALLKLNRFHWHFADDEAFRLEVDCAPDLWTKTAFRGEGEAVPGVFGGGIRAGGSYSKSDVRELLVHGATLNIGIMPEIEIPAHALAMNAAIPGLRDPKDSGPEASVQGYTGNTVNPALDATWALLGPLADEVAALFPLGVLHLGCDEPPPGMWDGSPAMDRLKADNGLATRDDALGWTMERLAGRLAAKGIRPAAWEEAARGTNGGIGHGALLFSWSGQGPGIAAARAGYDVVMCPAQHVYLDMAHTDGADDWGAAWAAFVALEDTVAWDPVPPDAPDIAPRIVGVQGAFWSEFTTLDAQIEPMIAPRILGVAAKAWNRGTSLDGPGLRALAGAYAPLFDRIGWTRHKGA